MSRDSALDVLGTVIHVLAAHPTPPVFDGPENRNGLRNFDEIRLFADYISPKKADYLTDDQGRRGGLAPQERFVLMGDFNADPFDGDSVNGAIQQLLDHPRVHSAVSTGNLVPRSLGGAKNKARKNDVGPPEYDTAGWGLRVDYVLPSANMAPVASGVFWPKDGTPESALVAFVDQRTTSSDHRLVWVDVKCLTRVPQH